MAVIGLVLIGLVLIGTIGLGVLYVFSSRRYQSGDSVAIAYGEWTQDGILSLFHHSSWIRSVHRTQ